MTLVFPDFGQCSSRSCISDCQVGKAIANPRLSLIANVTKTRKEHLDGAIVDRNGLVTDSDGKRWTLLLEILKTASDLGKGLLGEMRE